MRAAPLPPDEEGRLARLSSLRILDTPPEETFDRIVRLAHTLSGAPLALISLIDRNRQWFKASVGLDICETPRDVAFCAHAILHRETLWVQDATQDPRFSGNPLVTGAPFIRFYAGAPIVLATGERIGTVCVIAPEPRAYDPELDRSLTDLAAVVADECALRLALDDLAESQAATADTNALLKLALEIGDFALWEISYPAKRVIYHRASTTLFDWRPCFDDVADDLTAIVHDEDRPRIQAEWKQRLQEGGPYRGEYRIKRRDGRNVWVQAMAEVVRDAQGRPERVVGVMSDITALAEAKAAAEVAYAARTEFLEEMSHEFRTPLNGVLGLAGALARTPLTGEQAEIVSLIERSADSLERLLAELLAGPGGKRGEAAPHAGGESTAPVSARRPRVLMAEDNPVNRKVVELILASLEVDLVMVENGAEAVAAAGADRFDLILMDINMPVLDGLSAIRRIRALRDPLKARTPVLAVTANALPQQVAETLAAGADGHVAKPLTAEKLIEAVLSMLQLTGSRDALGRRDAA